MSVEQRLSPAAVRFSSVDAIRAHLAAGGDEDSQPARELARAALTRAGGGSFVVHRGPALRGKGWLISHAATGLLLSTKRPFRAKRSALACAAALKALRTADGRPFDWDLPGIRERVESYRGPRGEDLPTILARLKTDVELAELDALKRPPSGNGASFRGVSELRAYVRGLCDDVPRDGEKRIEFLLALAENPTLDLSDSGQLVYWHERGRRWIVATARTLETVTTIVGGLADARALADWIEDAVSDTGGRPFPFGTEDVHVRAQEWRSREDSTLRDAVTLARGAFDVARGVTASLEAQLADTIRQADARRLAIANRAAEGNYVTLRGRDLVMHDRVEFDVTVDRHTARYFTGRGAPGDGDGVTLHGTLTKHASLSRSYVALRFSRGGLRWSKDGRQGVVEGDRWQMSLGRYTAEDWPVYCDRPSPIAAVDPAHWEAVAAEHLARGIGINEAQLAPLSLAVTNATSAGTDFEHEWFTQLARKAAASYHELAVPKLDRALIGLSAKLDEYETWGQLDHPGRRKYGDPPLAALLLALAAERHRRELASPTPVYTEGPARARGLHVAGFDETAFEIMSADALRGAWDYTEARVLANAEWLASFRTDAITADGQGWRELRSALERERERRAAR